MMSEAQGIDLSYDCGKRVPVYLFPEDAVQALSHSYPYSQYRSSDEGHVISFSEIDEERARKVLKTEGILEGEGGWLTPDIAMKLVKEYGIPVAYTRAAFSAEEAASVARAAGFPVAMKLRSRTITHKTDVGGIFLGLQGEEEVKSAYHELVERLGEKGRISEMEGVVVQPMMEGGQEMIIGMSHYPVFGPLVMVGLGGIHVELLKDVAFSLHPLTDKDPDYMLRQLKGLPLLEGWRGSTPKDTEALKEVLLSFSALVEDFPEITEMEINPLIVFERGTGCMAVDARILFKPSTGL
jgi:acyl-CoA synthetase (NDP forming)